MASDLELALDKHKYVTAPGGTIGVNVTTISDLLDDGKSGAFAGAAVKLTREGKNYREEWKASGERGTRIHGHCEAFLAGEGVEMLPDEKGYVDALDKFMVDYDPRLIESEEVVVSKDFGYGGRFDFIAEIDGANCLIDLKTGKQYPVPHSMQLAAYWGSDGIAVYEEGMLTEVVPLPPIDRAGCLYVHGDGTYTLKWYLPDEMAMTRAWNCFISLLGVYNWTRSDSIKELVKEARRA